MKTKDELQEFISNLEDELYWVSFALIKKELKNIQQQKNLAFFMALIHQIQMWKMKDYSNM